MKGKHIDLKSSLFKLALILLMVTVFVTCVPERRIKVARGFAPKPCMDCHKEQLPEFNKKYVHSPMSKRDCEACHLRHGKLAVRAFVEGEERKLCYICHTQMASEMEKSV
ncbi:MAG TPA: hypothetical protein ENH18_04265, partial [Nitrospirae bacterium]|nr:hypothetical protein [Nitrospirota bacterium]HEW81567.1 hypothetical protein [Nitrospirota bacterium]